MGGGEVSYKIKRVIIIIIKKMCMDFPEEWKGRGVLENSFCGRDMDSVMTQCKCYAIIVFHF